MQPIGTRVIYRDQDRTCRGTVTKHYKGGYTAYDEEQCETYIVPDHVSVKVSPLPDWWPYNDSDTFSPEANTLTEIKS